MDSAPVPTPTHLALPDSPLVSATWLLEQLHHPKLRVIDVRFTLGQPQAGFGAYRAGHIPGAVFLDLERDLSSPVRPDRQGGRHPLPEPAILAAKLGALGIGHQHSLVTYDDPSAGQGFYAAHLRWLLRYLGHDRICVLDGGLPAWTAAGGGLETSIPTHPSTRFEAQPRAEMILDADAVATRGEHALLIDSRAGARYRGEIEPLDPKAGHIPSAINRDWSASLTTDGHWKSAEEQRARFEGLTGQGSELIVYCGSGVSACANLLALELAGVKDAKLYAGSWSDWVSDPERPVATGDQP